MIRLPRPFSLSLSLFTATALIGCASTQTTEPAPAPAQAPPAETRPAPMAEPTPTPPPPALAPREEVAPASSDDSYHVAPGDHLWGISSQASVYGDPYRWPLIYKANTDKIEDADLIYPGQVLTIRRGASQAEINAAVEHARHRGAWTLGAVEDTDRQYLAGKRYAAGH